MKRFQARRHGGRFTRNTPENTMGMHFNICPHCGSFNPSTVGEPRPETCHRCQRSIAHACVFGRVYVLEQLVFAGWSVGDGSGAEGYLAGEYFTADGLYLGPDAHGIEPLFEQVPT